MASNSDEKLPLKSEEGELPDNSAAVSPLSSSSSSPTFQRHAYRRMASEDRTAHPPLYHSPTFSIGGFDSGQGAQGLGITQRPRPASIARVPVGSRTSFSPPMSSSAFQKTPTVRSPSLAESSKSPPPWQRYDTTYDGQPLGEVAEQDVQEGSGKHSSFTEDLPNAGEAVRKQISPTLTPTTAMNNDNDNDNDNKQDKDKDNMLGGCPPRRNIHSRRTSWLSISIFSLSIYSTIFSGFWLVLALVQPRYGRIVRSGGSLTPSTASTVFALFAKTIELSFVTVFVTFLGQVLSRRSLIKGSRGVTIAEMTMRTWVIQPGFMITHWKNLQHAGLTILGAITLIAAMAAMFYTTASDSIVSPHLKYGKYEKMNMQGLVRVNYANPYYIADSCQTPITQQIDPDNAGSTCLSIEHAGEAYHNAIVFLNTWAQISNGSDGSSDMAVRPRPPAMLFDNTTVTGSWVSLSSSDVTSAHQKYGRLVNNVTMSMPHAGVFAAAKDSRNNILQPEDLDGVGEYYVRASVVSPSVNVMCVNMNASEVAPLIYTTWPHARTNISTIPGQKIAQPDYERDIQPPSGREYLNTTVVDDIFEWGPKYGRQPPIFPMYPIDYNSITNISVPLNSDSLYLLIKAPETATPDYTICQMRSFLSPVCSTQYNVSGTTGGHLESHCEDPDDDMAYRRSTVDAPVTRSTDWRNVAQNWMLALSLDTGISNANASNSRLLSQMILTMPSGATPKLDPAMPSIAETLAVMVGNTLLLSSTDATFYHYWDEKSERLDPGKYQPFNSTLSSQQYTSGYTQQWEAIFYLVLVVVFITNIFCLSYFVVRAGLVTDYTESQNMFALAVNSPPSRRLSGSCGAGPEADQLKIGWKIIQQGDSGHLYIKDAGGGARQDYELRRRNPHTASISSYSMLSNPRESRL